MLFIGGLHLLWKDRNVSPQDIRHIEIIHDNGLEVVGLSSLNNERVIVEGSNIRKCQSEVMAMVHNDPGRSSCFRERKGR